MAITAHVDEQGIAEVVVDAPPVNALTVAGWFELARTLTELGEDRAVRVVVLRADGRGFNAGVDIKEMQNTEGFDALIGANKGCFAAFAAVLGVVARHDHVGVPHQADPTTVAIADTFRGDGEIMANPIGNIPMIGGRVARAVFEPDLMMTDGEALLVANPMPVGVDDPEKVVEA